MAQTRTQEPLEPACDAHTNMLDSLRRADGRQERRRQAVFTAFHWQFYLFEKPLAFGEETYNKL